MRRLWLKSQTESTYEELHQLVEGLIVEVENLHSQLESHEDEISCLSQEATKSTFDVPALWENIDKKNHDILDPKVGL